MVELEAGTPKILIATLYSLLRVLLFVSQNDRHLFMSATLYSPKFRSMPISLMYSSPQPSSPSPSPSPEPSSPSPELSSPSLSKMDSSATRVRVPSHTSLIYAMPEMILILCFNVPTTVSECH